MSVDVHTCSAFCIQKYVKLTEIEKKSIAPFILVIRMRFVSGNCDELASIVASSFNYKVADAVRFVYHFCGGLLFTCSKNPPSTTEYAQRWSKQT